MDGRQWVVSMAGFWAKVAPVVLRTQAAHGMGSNTDPHLKIKSHMASTWQKLGINPGHALAVLSACGLCCEWPRPGADLIYCPVLASADPPTHVWPVDHCQWKWRCGRALKLVHPPNLKQFMACQLEMNHLQVEHGADFYLWRLGAAWRMGDQWELMMRWWPADMDDVPVESEIDTLGSLGGNLIEVLMRARTVPAAGIAWDAMTEVGKGRKMGCVLCLFFL